jgi:Ca-activated chloride channel homolog
MKSIRLTFAMLLMVLGPMLPAMSFRPANAAVQLEGRVNCPYVSNNGGTVYLQLAVTVPDADRSRRRPMNIAVVLDRSGSMGDARKMEYARQALLNIINQLRSDDIFSLVIYDDVIEVPFPAQRVERRDVLRRIVEGIYPRGSTNLGGGMMEGFAQVERNRNREYVNRVILLSDGLANQGVTNPEELNRIARRRRASSISLTTMGVGLEYNENLMMGLAEAGGGNYYYIESPYSLASIMSRELESASAIVAQNASVELSLFRGVKVLDVIGYEHRANGDRHIIELGDLYALDSRDITVELSVPEGSGRFTAVRGTLFSDSPLMRLQPQPVFFVEIAYTSDISQIKQNTDWSTQARADIAISTRKVEQALKDIDEGRSENATATLSEAMSKLAASPAMSNAPAAESAALNAQVDKLKSYNQIILRGGRAGAADARAVKKGIQYQNRETQKKK